PTPGARRGASAGELAPQRGDAPLAFARERPELVQVPPHVAQQVRHLSAQVEHLPRLRAERVLRDPHGHADLADQGILGRPERADLRLEVAHVSFGGATAECEDGGRRHEGAGRRAAPGFLHDFRLGSLPRDESGGGIPQGSYRQRDGGLIAFAPAVITNSPRRLAAQTSSPEPVRSGRPSPKETVSKRSADRPKPVRNSRIASARRLPSARLYSVEP